MAAFKITAVDKNMFNVDIKVTNVILMIFV